MDPQIALLESLRQQIDAAEWMAGSLVDYLGHGSPDDCQREKAAASIAAYDASSAEARRRSGPQNPSRDHSGRPGEPEGRAILDR